MDRYLRHRYALALPFVLLVVIALIGGLLNGVTASGRVVDDYSGDPVAGAELSVGKRMTSTSEDGSYLMENVPRTTDIRVDAGPGGGYFRTSAPAHGGDIRMQPNSLTVVVNVEGTDPPERIGLAQVRQETRILGTTNPSGNTVVTPHPGRDAKLLVCAKDFASKEITARGVLTTVTLVRQPGADCPVIPTPTPDPNAPSPSPSPAVSPSPGPSPTPSPSAP